MTLEQVAAVPALPCRVLAVYGRWCERVLVLGGVRGRHGGMMVVTDGQKSVPPLPACLSSRYDAWCEAPQSMMSSSWGSSWGSPSRVLLGAACK